MGRLGIVVLLGLAGCARDPTCEESVSRYSELLDGLDHYCIVDADCRAVGGPDGCDDSGSCLPEAAARSDAIARHGGELSEISDQVRDSCAGELQCPLDADTPTARCQNNTCRVVSTSCLPVPPTCAENLYAYWFYLDQVDRSCVVPSDCVVVGSPESCDCDFTVTGGGFAVNAVSLAAEENLADLEAELRDQFYAGECDAEELCVFDAGDPTADCIQDTCVLVNDDTCLQP